MTFVLTMATMVYAHPAGEEQWNRYLDKGTGFYFDGQPDSAKFYLLPVFESGSDQKTTAARYLLDIAINEGDTPKINEYALYLADNYDLSIDQERQKSHRRVIIIVTAALFVLLILGGVSVVLFRRHKREEVALKTTIKEQAMVHLVKQTHEIYSHGNPRKRILEAFNAAYPHGYERLKATYPNLTDQECDILVLNFLEFRIKEEAEILALSPNTVMKYRSNLIKKVGKDPVAELLK